MYLKPKTAKRMHFDVIPKAVDEYHQQLRAYPTQDAAGQANNPVWHIHSGNVPESHMVVPFSMLLNLTSAAGAEDKDTMWAFIKRYAPDASPETHADLDQAAGFAVRFYEDFVKPTKTFRAPDAKERAAMEDLASRLEAHDGPTDDETLQTIVFAVGKDHGFDPLRDWFKALYEVLLGQSQGPRFGGFVALYGVDESVALIRKGLAGELS
jgi:lysyl-tRNA synthetase class 1